MKTLWQVKAAVVLGQIGRSTEADSRCWGVLSGQKLKGAAPKRRPFLFLVRQLRSDAREPKKEQN
jgi:hypothetical protein